MTPPQLPYVVGNELELKTSVGESLKAFITKVYPITVSPVMEIRATVSGQEGMYILKMFDRRAGHFRDKNPYNETSQAVWQSYVRSGKAKTLLEDLQHEDDMIKRARLKKDGDAESDEKESSDDDDDEDNKEDEAAEEETLIYFRARKLHRNEVRAYSQLKTLQGRCVPNFIECVTLSDTDAPRDLPDVYFQIPGVILSIVPGVPLSELTSLLPDQPDRWEEVVQDAMSVAKEVNKAGVVHWDCQPRNILLSSIEAGFQPFMIDFAQCALKDDYKDTDDLDDDNGYKALVYAADNAGAIAVIMKQKVARTTHYKINIQVEEDYT